MDNTQFAELLMGIAKAQNAVIDAMERANPGFKNTHAVPILTTAANVRAAVPRLQDLPSRILLRMQGRAAFDVTAIEQDLEHALAAAANAPPAAVAGPQARAAAAAASRPVSSDVSRPAAAAAPRPAPVAAPTAAPAGAGTAPRSAALPDDLDFSAKR